MSTGQSISAACVIDSLPDSVLCYILSFLPTKDAAVTSVLSKRWRPLWLSLFTLDFDDGVFPDFRTFRHFVYSVLLSRDSVRSLRLKCGTSYGFDPGDISVFFYAAALKGIKNLHLHAHFKLLLPNCVLSCRTLVVVKLHNLILGSFCYVHFPLLKSLHLDDVLFESRGHVTKFLCGCPNLEDFQAKTLHIGVGPKDAEVEVKSLNKLVRVNISDSYIPFDVLCNAEFFSARLHFIRRAYNPRFHNLTHMELIFGLVFEYMGCDVTWKWLVEVLQNCPKLQNLTIHEEYACVKKVGDVHWKEPQIVPECLSSQLRTFTLRYFKGMECEKKKMSTGQSISAACVIDSLPDSVLCYILSFLPTKDAAVTSVLSKRWRPLWLSLFTLDFDDGVFPDFCRFRYFVYSALFSRDSVRSLSLKCGISRRFDPGDINVFFYAAALKGIKNLHLHMYCKILLPNCVFSCRTLVVVKLQNLILGSFCYVHFPLLKSLHLDDVLFESRGHVTKFLCGCPSLEDLQAKTLHIDIMVGPKEAEEEEVKSLSKLVRVNISDSYIPFDVLCNAEFFSARLDFSHCVYNPRFHNLTHMELSFESIGCNVKWKWLVEVLQNCPKLQNLTIHEVSACENEVGDVHWKEPQIVPECLSSQLRTFTLRYFKGMECEVRFARYILQNSKVLCNMIFPSTCLDMDLKHQMLKNFSVCPRGSATCNLLFD